MNSDISWSSATGSASQTVISHSTAAGELKDAGFEVDGAANVTVRLHEDGSLAGYTIGDSDGLWTIATTFFDIGGSFSA